MHLYKEGFEDTKGIISLRKSKKHRKHNDQKKNYERTSNDLQKHTHKTKDRVKRTPLKPGDERRCSRSGTHRGNIVTNLVISHEPGEDSDVFSTSGTYPWSFKYLPYSYSFYKPVSSGTDV
jgi:hypothetical protein